MNKNSSHNQVSSVEEDYNHTNSVVHIEIRLRANHEIIGHRKKISNCKVHREIDQYQHAKNNFKNHYSSFLLLYIFA